MSDWTLAGYRVEKYFFARLRRLKCALDGSISAHIFYNFYSLLFEKTV
jgi:hypothetical protein